MSIDLSNNHPVAVLRRKSKLTQAELATRIGVTQNNVSRWERGIITPSLKHLRTMSVLFDLSIGELTDMIECEKAVR